MQRVELEESALHTAVKQCFYEGFFFRHKLFFVKNGFFIRKIIMHLCYIHVHSCEKFIFIIIIKIMSFFANKSHQNIFFQLIKKNSKIQILFFEKFKFFKFSFVKGTGFSYTTLVDESDVAMWFLATGL